SFGDMASASVQGALEGIVMRLDPCGENFLRRLHQLADVALEGEELGIGRSADAKLGPRSGKPKARLAPAGARSRNARHGGTPLERLGLSTNAGVSETP